MLQELRSRRVTGRSARLLMRFLREVFIHERNAYLYEELVTSPKRQDRLFGGLEADLGGIEAKADGPPLVEEILVSCRTLLGRFAAGDHETPALRSRVKRTLAAVVGPANVWFGPFTLVAAISGLGLHAIPRGAGTGLTGGSVPLARRCVVVDTEALNQIRGIERRTYAREDGSRFEGAVLTLDAGVVTERAMEDAEEHGLVFATGPTSAWACTIGGNIAENAGGKTAVLWGACIHSLLSWRTALPDGRVLVTTRDGQYVRAIGYRTKAARAETPKTVILIDEVGKTPWPGGVGDRDDP